MAVQYRNGGFIYGVLDVTGDVKVNGTSLSALSASGGGGGGDSGQTTPLVLELTDGGVDWDLDDGRYAYVDMIDAATLNVFNLPIGESILMAVQDLGGGNILTLNPDWLRVGAQSLAPSTTTLYKIFNTGNGSFYPAVQILSGFTQPPP